MYRCFAPEETIKRLEPLDLIPFPTRSLILPDEVLKLPEGQDAHAPADDPPQPLRYWPATHDAAEQVEQTEDPAS